MVNYRSSKHPPSAVWASNRGERKGGEKIRDWLAAITFSKPTLGFRREGKGEREPTWSSAVRWRSGKRKEGENRMAKTSCIQCHAFLRPLKNLCTF